MLASKPIRVESDTGRWVEAYVSAEHIRPVKIIAFDNRTGVDTKYEVNAYLYRRTPTSRYDYTWWLLVEPGVEPEEHLCGLHAETTTYALGDIYPEPGRRLRYYRFCRGCYSSGFVAGKYVEIVPTGKEIHLQKQNIFTTAFTLHRDAKNEVGIELELENLTSNYWTSTPERADRVRRIQDKYSLIHDIGTDGSVRGMGPEIRFNHPSLSKWKIKDIRNIMKDMTDAGFTAGDSAGQHVHISHPKIILAIRKCEQDIKGMNDFLKPISCRHTERYGMNSNIIRNQFSTFGTLEIRVWESTTNPELFRKRAKFANDLVKCLIKPGVNYKNIWHRMPESMIKDYVDMLYTENDHVYGMSVNKCLNKLPKTARAYARIKYGFKRTPKGANNDSMD